MPRRQTEHLTPIVSYGIDPPYSSMHESKNSDARSTKIIGAIYLRMKPRFPTAFRISNLLKIFQNKRDLSKHSESALYSILQGKRPV